MRAAIGLHSRWWAILVEIEELVRLPVPSRASTVHAVPYLSGGYSSSALMASWV